MPPFDTRVKDMQADTGIFRWRIIPVVILASFGLLFASLGGFSCWGVWCMGYGVLSIHMSAVVCVALAGIAWILAAHAFIRAKWLIGWTSTLIGLGLYIVCTITQYVAFLPNNDVDARHQVDSATGPVGPNAVSILETVSQPQDSRTSICSSALERQVVERAADSKSSSTATRSYLAMTMLLSKLMRLTWWGA